MPTIFSHPAVPLGLAPWVRRMPASLIHSIVFALLFSAFAAFAYVRLARTDVTFRAAFTFLFVALLSHGILDAMTTGGKGVGFFIPFSNHRYFFPFRPIRVSPIGAEDFAARAAVVLASELRWVWAPMALIGILGLVTRRIRQ